MPENETSRARVYEPVYRAEGFSIPTFGTSIPWCWIWSKAARRAYANDVTDPGHLLAVSAAANRSKGDRDPAQWLPPDPTFKCRYLEIWIGVKSTWHLAADQAEFEALLSGLQGCP